LARALVLAPQLLVADEPSGQQDFGWRNRVFESLRLATEDGTACVAATPRDAVVWDLSVRRCPVETPGSVLLPPYDGFTGLS
jgi:ABC-type ATPase involved in cell division